MDLERTISENKIQLQQTVESMDLGLLVRASAADSEIDLICKHPALNHNWDERWRKCGSNPQEKAKLNNLPIVEYKPQSTIHTFDLLKGIYFYGQYIKNKNNPVLAQEYLELAAQLGHFASLNVLTKENMKDSNNLVIAVVYAQMAAQLYWTPGYLLLSAFYFEQEFYKEALLNLMIAEKLISHSENMINNAYQGRDFTTMINKIMNELNVSTLNEAKLKLARLGGLPIHFITNILDKEASRQVKELLKTKTKSTDSSCTERCSNNDHSDPSPDGAMISCF